ncbi:MAG: Na+/H+ antiporter NhaA [Planktomarina sp.]
MPLIRAVDRFFKHDASGGILLMLAAIAALVVANTDMRAAYESTLNAYLTFTYDGEGIKKPLLLWINDGLMAIFFFYVGLELKREMMIGKLNKPSEVILPGMAAVGGMIVPAIIFVMLNWGNTVTINGWAIPAATDIAFALGILALVGKRAPASLKIFLLTLATLDDMGAIIIIALFYTAELKVDYLIMALLPLVGMLYLNLKGAHRRAPILMLGLVLWFLVLRSGVHATLAGVVTAFFIPLTDKFGKSPLQSLEHGVAPYVLFLIVPIFAFANAGVVLEGMSMSDLLQPVPLGIAAGLVLGKQIGVFGITFAMVKFGMAKLPHNATWRHIYGVACLAGIGFTMSLFIGSLSYTDDALMNQVRLGVLSGSAISAIIGYTVLMIGKPVEEPAQPASAHH